MEVWLSSFKNKPIPCCLDTPANEDDNVHKESHIELGSKGSQNWKCIPLNYGQVEQRPTAACKRAMQKQMFHSFLH
jgi:hypothetical protein